MLSIACSMIVTSGWAFEYVSATSRLVASSKMWAILMRFPSGRCCILSARFSSSRASSRKASPRGRECDMTAVADKELSAELILELADLLC